MARNRLEKALQEKNATITHADRFSSYKAVKQKQARMRLIKNSFIAAAVLMVLCGFIYIPQFFIIDGSEQTAVYGKDINAIGTYNQCIKDHPNDDFDGDGILNSVEKSKNLNIWDVDTDGDGLTDSYEISINENPAIYSNTLTVTIKNWLGSKGLDEKTPYKINGCILWAKDIKARTYGTVVRSVNGYQFNNFRGYVQFPENGYAYKVENGIHKLLKYRKEENAWEITGDYEVIIEQNELEMTNRLGFFGNNIYLPDFFKGLSFILPDKGFLTCTRMAVSDADPDAKRNKIVTQQSLSNYTFKKENSRFAKNDNTLEDLAMVRAFIDEGKPLAVSLFDEDEGEAVFIVNGYTADGNLMLVDISTKQNAGILEITMNATNVFDGENLLQKERFEFAGMGFSSYEGDRISFLDNMFK